MAKFLKDNAVTLVAALAALVPACFVPPCVGYLDYFDWNTLGCIFCILAVVAAAKRARLFDVVARGFVSRFSTTCSVLVALVSLTLVASMFVTNDMALIMFLPLAAMVLFRAGQAWLVPFCFVMQDVAANLGGMIMPFGSPQNLYLFSKFGLDLGSFLSVMAMPFLVSVVLIVVSCCAYARGGSLSVRTEGAADVDVRRAVGYGALFALALLAVFRVVPFWLPVLVIVGVLLFVDRDALREVNYGLLLTFVFFFVFSGNLAEIPAAQELFAWLLSFGTMASSALACQVMSNVPTAVLFAQFTTDWPGLLVGVNIGGAGTLVASLASLITFEEFRVVQAAGRAKGGDVGKRFGTGRYLALFTLVNFAFLGVLLAVGWSLGY